jgi:hypothetical protein
MQYLLLQKMSDVPLAGILRESFQRSNGVFADTAILGSDRILHGAVLLPSSDIVTQLNRFVK